MVYRARFYKNARLLYPSAPTHVISAGDMELLPNHTYTREGNNQFSTNSLHSDSTWTAWKKIDAHDVMQFKRTDHTQFAYGHHPFTVYDSAGHRYSPCFFVVRLSEHSWRSPFSTCDASNSVNKKKLIERLTIS